MTVLTFVFQGTELSVFLQALRAHKEVQNVLSSPIPSASQIAKDAETIHALLHKDFATARHPQVRPEEQNQLINLMTNITQQMENFQPESSDIGPALHAARQVGYWSSVFISMVSNNTSAQTSVSNSLPMVTAPVISSGINPSPLASQALIPCTINEATPTTHLSSSIQSSTTQHPQPSFIPSSLNLPTLPISTATVISFGINPSNLASQALIPSTMNQAASTTHLTPSVQSSTTQHPQPSFIPSSFNHPALPISTAAAISFGINPSNLASQALIPSTINQAAPTAHATPVSCTDPATMAVFREYGSGLLNEWLDSLTIPRNVENLQQVKEIWEVGNVYCPPLHKWTVTMRNHRSKTGKNSSIFSQRKYIYNLFKNCNFDENLVFTRYNEQRPGKLYKMLNTKSK